MNKPVKVLVVEDSEDDAKLAIRALRRGGFEVHYERVESAAAMRAALGREAWDAVISDHKMPGFTGLDALAILKASGLDIPFILISGTIGEEIAVEAMKAGANDYVMKKSLARLAPALKRELHEAKLRAAHRRAQHDLQATFEQAGVGIAHISRERRILRANRKLGLMLGLPAAELAGTAVIDLSHPEDRETVTADRNRLYAGEIEQVVGEKRYLRRDGEVLWARVTVSLARDEAGAPEYEIAVFEDITRERRARSKMGRIRAALDMSFDAVYVVSRRDMKIVDTNEAACRMLGYTREELIGASPRMLFADANLTDERLAAEYDAVLADPARHSTIETMHRRKDGIPVPVELQRGTVALKGTRYLLAVARDASARRATDRALRESEERYRNLVELSPDATYVIRDGRFAFANAEALRLFGVGDAAGLIGRPALEFTHPDYRETTAQRLRALDTGQKFNPGTEQVFLRSDGAPVQVEVQSSRISFGGGAAALVISRDIGERKRAERKIAQHAQRQTLVARFAEYALRETDLAALFNEAVRAARGDEANAAMLLELSGTGGFTVRAACGEPAEDFVGKSHPVSPDSMWPELLESNTPRLVGADYLRSRPVQSGWRAWIHQMGSAIYAPVRGEAARAMLAIYSRREGAFDESDARHAAAIGDILSTALRRRSAEERLAHLAQFDTLTALPNRSLFRDRLDQALAQARRNDWLVGAMLVDLDNFKRVNDTLGHGAGDALLVGVALRLQAGLREGDTVARLGGDEFAVILPGIESPENARLVAQKLLDALKAPFDLGGNEIFAGASIGVAVYPPDAADSETLLKNADVAMYRAKEAGRNGYQFFTSEMNADSARRMAVEQDLRHALERGEFELHYQPKAEVSGARVTGAEALLRWRRSDGALVSPVEFIPILEDTGLIAEVGDWVIGEACRQHARWEHAGIRGLRVSVNVSARQFRGGELIGSVRRALAESGCLPQCLELEITESLVMHDVEVTIETLEALRAMGVRVSVDDFGTGYSSLAYLKRLPIDVLKIDRAFVKDLSENPDDAAIVTAITAMARSLGYRVIAEGVETPLQRQFLETCGCHEIQGYLLSRPLPADKLAQWLAGRERIDCREKLAA